MRKNSLLASVGVLALSSTAASTPPPRSRSFDCGTNTEHASDDFLKSIQALHADSNSGSPAARAGLQARQKDNHSAITVDAVFHVVAKKEHKADITDAMPQAQLDTLNAAYQDYGIRFHLVNVTWTSNDAWAVGDGDADQQMKHSLRQGTYRTLNLYFQTDLGGGVLGRCTLPSAVTHGKTAPDPSLYAGDGCNVNANTMPDGAMDGYNRGKTAVHETGHWLGLLHTFEGHACDGPGDYIDDTPFEKESTDGCPVDPPKRTCPDQPGRDKDDPIHNYMDYSEDACYEGFTRGQRDRMHALYRLYREGR